MQSALELKGAIFDINIKLQYLKAQYKLLGINREKLYKELVQAESREVKDGNSDKSSGEDKPKV